MTALLLDFDGTLLDSESSHLQSWEEAYLAHGHRLDREAWVAGVGGHGLFDPHGGLADLVGEGFDAEAVTALRRARELDLVHALSPRDGVHELLALDVRFAVVSSSPRSWVVPHLDRLGLLGRMEVVVCREDAPRGKPAPDLYVEALRRLDVSSGVAVEDSANGVAAAKAAGLQVLAVPGPVTAGQDLSHADLRVSSLLEVDLQALADGRLSRR